MSYPANPEFRAINVTSRNANVRTETRSGRVQVRTIGAQKWAFSASYNNLSRDEFAPVYAFVMAQNGGVGEFDIVPPVIGSTSGTATGAVTVSANAAAGLTAVSVNDITGTLKAGDFIKFSNHTKVYMVTADASGTTVAFTPALQFAVSSGNTIQYNDVPFKMRLDNDVQEYRFSGYDRYQFEVDLIEVI